MAGVDRLSALPSEVKTYILNHLPIDKAVCTSALSRSWRHIWTHLPGFFFDLSLPDEPYRLARHASISRGIEVVQHLISSLCGPIIYFHLHSFSRYYVDLDLFEILELIFKKGDLQMLWIKNEGCQSFIELPYFRYLTVLQLDNFHICLPSDFQGFEHLEVLSLYNVNISQKNVDLLIKESKKLRIFKGTLYSANEECLSVTFSSPLLTGIEFYFTESIKEARVLAAPRLKEADIGSEITATASSEDFAYLAVMTLTFLADIATVSDFALDFDTLKCLSQVDVSYTLRVQFQQLKSLQLTGEISYLDERVYTIFCCLLRTMPILESLDIKNSLISNIGQLVQIPNQSCCDPCVEEGLDESDAIPLYECIKKEGGICCLDQTLRWVTISMAKSIHPVLMSMIRFILLNARVLEIIEIRHRDDNEVKPSIREELCGVHKASCNANVVYSSISGSW